MKDSSSGEMRTTSPYLACSFMFQGGSVPKTRCQTKGNGVAAARVGPGNFRRGWNQTLCTDLITKRTKITTRH